MLVCLLGLAVEVYTLAFQFTTQVEAKGAHQIPLKEFGARVPITQTFTMRSGGLRGVRIRLAASARCDITLDWLLSEQHEPTVAVARYGNRIRLRNVSGERWAVIQFPAIAESTGRTYKLDVRALDVQLHDRGRSPLPASDGAALVASLDDAMPQGVLVVGGQERWGDLVFDTLALGDTILGRFMLTTAPGLDGPLRRALLPSAAFALYNILLAMFVVHFWPRLPAVPQESDLRPAPAVDAAAGRRRRIRYVTIACALAAIAGEYARRSRQPPVDLMDEFHTAELQSSLGIHVSFALGEDRVGDESMRAIAAHPQSEIAWTLTIPAGARLRTAIATVPSTWNPLGDGVVFRIGVSESGTYSELFTHHLDPARVPAERRWVPVDLDLSRFSGRRIRLIFKTDASLPGWPVNLSYDSARWGAPRIVPHRTDLQLSQ